jgi:hypothetical protein
MWHAGAIIAVVSVADRGSATVLVALVARISARDRPLLPDASVLDVSM